ncbi:MAG: hypothetical protein JW847_05670 [Candidatus Omnitrophica bacterium]|nr:hypothetical protein [Candidatus Omnitrophota bacterium]
MNQQVAQSVVAVLIPRQGTAGGLGFTLLIHTTLGQSPFPIFPIKIKGRLFPVRNLIRADRRFNSNHLPPRQFLCVAINAGKLLFIKSNILLVDRVAAGLQPP